MASDIIEPGSVKGLIAAIHFPGLAPVQNGHALLNARLESIENTARLHVHSGGFLSLNQCAPIHGGKCLHDYRQIDKGSKCAAESQRRFHLSTVHRPGWRYSGSGGYS